MALPTTRRHQVESYFQEEDPYTEPPTPAPVVTRINTLEVFFKTMVEWYKNLGPKEAKRLTPKRFKRKAVDVLFKLRYPYVRLPLDWIVRLENMCDLQLYKKVKVAKVSDDLEDKAVAVKIDPLISHLPQTSKELVLNGNGKSTKKEESKISVKKDEPKAKRSSGLKVMDLTDMSPPEWWIKAYKNGQKLPRVLIVDQFKDKLVAYYDYEPKLKPLKKQSKEVKYESVCHLDDGFNWWGFHFDDFDDAKLRGLTYEELLQKEIEYEANRHKRIKLGMDS